MRDHEHWRHPDVFALPGANPASSLAAVRAAVRGLRRTSDTRSGRAFLHEVRRPGREVLRERRLRAAFAGRSGILPILRNERRSSVDRRHWRPLPDLRPNGEMR